MIAGQNTFRSAGERLVVSCPSTTTSSSTTVAPGVPQIGPDAGPGGQPPTGHEAGLQQRPRRTADRGDWLAPLGERFDERDGAGVHAQWCSRPIA